LYSAYIMMVLMHIKMLCCDQRLEVKVANDDACHDDDNECYDDFWMVTFSSFLTVLALKGSYAVVACC